MSLQVLRIFAIKGYRGRMQSEVDMGLFFSFKMGEIIVCSRE